MFSEETGEDEPEIQQLKINIILDLIWKGERILAQRKNDVHEMTRSGYERLSEYIYKYNCGI